MNYTYLLVGAGLGGISYYAYNNPEFFFPYIFNLVNFYHKTVDYYVKEEPIKRKHSRINLICYNTTNKEEMIRQDIKEVIDTETNKQYDYLTFQAFSKNTKLLKLLLTYLNIIMSFYKPFKKSKKG